MSATVVVLMPLFTKETINKTKGNLWTGRKYLQTM